MGVPPGILACIAWQIMAGLVHLHSHRLIHSSIEPRHVLHNTGGEVKISEFRRSRDFEQLDYGCNACIPLQIYMSPERCLGEDYSFKSDVWNVGMVIYELACGRYPFEDTSSFIALFESSCEKPEPRLDAKEFPPELCEFTACCLTRDVAQRPDTSTLYHHPFVS